MNLCHKYITIKISFHISPSDDLACTLCLRSAKYDIGRFLKQAERYQLLRKDFEDFTSWEKPYLDQSFNMTMRSGEFIILPQRDSDGHRVIILRPGVREGTMHKTHADFWRTLMVNLVLCLNSDDITSLLGFVLIFDGSYTGKQHLPGVKDLQFAVKSQNARFAPVKKVILYKFPFLLTTTVRIYKSLLSNKMGQRIEIAGSNEDLHSYLQPKSILPQIYDGDETEKNTEAFVKKLWTTTEPRTTAYQRAMRLDYDKMPKTGWFA